MSNGRAWYSDRPRSVDELIVVAVAVLSRLALVVWAWGRFPPADDGTFYHVVADRISHGLGYTWLWPDGVVTYAAHYPVGYPALMAVAYALFGSRPESAMLFNAVIGVVGAIATRRLCRTVAPRGPALAGGLLAALHPSLLFYTPALMTEGITAALIALLAALAVGARERRGAWPVLGLGFLSGLLVLIRPQALLVAPVFGAISSRAPGRPRLRRALGVTALAIFVCLPWTLRNCARLDRCAFVSANGGWNLFIGSAEKANGRWVSLEELGVPVECRNEFGEAGKDQCFGRAGLRNVMSRPGHFVGLIPAKLRATFDWSGAPGHYLSTSNPGAFPERSSLALGLAEGLVERVSLLFALLALGRGEGPYPRSRRAIAAVAALVLLPMAWLSHVLLLLLVACFGAKIWERPVALAAGATVGATIATHAVFFGAGRYGLVCVLVLIPLAAEGLALFGGRWWPHPGRRVGLGSAPS
jgi:4-amino-4-deoxy-L-arabinose transferase-like glycosyltransferase